MIKIAAIEDEAAIRHEIYGYIRQGAEADTEVNVEIRTYGSAEEYLSSEKDYDLVITDIDLPGMSGLELGKRVKKKNPEVYLAFLTSYTKFASDSYIIEANQYVLKKDMESRLPGLVEKVIARIKKSYEEFCWIRSNRELQKIFLKDIIYICKIKGSKYIKYVTAETIYTERLPINQIFDNICNNAFIFADRGHILNMNHIKRLRGTSVYMDNGDEIIVNRVQCMQIKEKIMEYWRVSR